MQAAALGAAVALLSTGVVDARGGSGGPLCRADQNAGASTSGLPSAKLAVPKAGSVPRP